MIAQGLNIDIQTKEQKETNLDLIRRAPILKQFQKKH